MPDALLLDWEGCIIETLSMRMAALQRALRDEGVALADDDCTRCCDGASVDTSVQRARADVGTTDPVLADLVAARARRAFAERLGKGFVVRPGARELLDGAQSNSRIAIVTQASRAETAFVLLLTGLDRGISTIISADDALEPPPSPASFIAAVAQLSRVRAIRPEHSIVLASSADLLRAARMAGLRTIAVCAPAHVALEADGAVDTLDGISMSALSRIAGLPAAEQRA